MGSPVSECERNRRAGSRGADFAGPIFLRGGSRFRAHHQTVQRCFELVAFGPMATLDDRPRSAREATITAEARALLVSLACRKAKELGYPLELWTTRLLARHSQNDTASRTREPTSRTSEEHKVSESDTFRVARLISGRRPAHLSCRIEWSRAEVMPRCIATPRKLSARRRAGGSRSARAR
jgi:hypothetical protein